jgi:hypothetical protein
MRGKREASAESTYDELFPGFKHKYSKDGLEDDFVTPKILAEGRGAEAGRVREDGRTCHAGDTMNRCSKDCSRV